MEVNATIWIFNYGKMVWVYANLNEAVKRNIKAGASAICFKPRNV